MFGRAGNFCVASIFKKAVFLRRKEKTCPIFSTNLSSTKGNVRSGPLREKRRSCHIHSCHYHCQKKDKLLISKAFRSPYARVKLCRNCIFSGQEFLNVHSNSTFITEVTIHVFQVCLFRPAFKKQEKRNRVSTNMILFPLNEERAHTNSEERYKNVPHSSRFGKKHRHSIIRISQ